MATLATMTGPTERDRRPVALISSGLSPEAFAGADGAARRAHASEVRELAARLGFRLVALPEPGHRGRPDADAAERRRLGRADRASLVATLRELRGWLAPESPVAALLLVEDDLWGQAGRAWAQRLADAAAEVGLVLPRPVRLSLDAGVDEDRLAQRLLAEAGS